VETGGFETHHRFTTHSKERHHRGVTSSHSFNSTLTRRKGESPREGRGSRRAGRHATRRNNERRKQKIGSRFFPTSQQHKMEKTNWLQRLPPVT
jgi:hypothetical protein